MLHDYCGCSLLVGWDAKELRGWYGFEIIQLPDAYHEVYAERDEIRDVVINETKAFLESN